MIYRLNILYKYNTIAGRRFRYGLLLFDIFTFSFVIFTSFFPHTRTIELIDIFIGTLILLDISARTAIQNHKSILFKKVTTWADIAATISFIAPIAGESFGFLRIFRTLRFLRTYQMLVRMREDSVFFRKHEYTILAAINLTVFLFVTTAVVYISQSGSNPAIVNYADAFYFTVTTLSTTGFGDITLVGTSGRMLSVAIMIIGITLFFRLAQVLFRPAKVLIECGKCGLFRHDPDAIHCKHCGETINIRTEGGS